MTDPNLPEIPSSEEKRPEPSVERSKLAMEKEATGAPFGTPGWERATLERLAFASLEEQRSARRWRNFVRLAWLLAFVVLGWTIFSRSAPSSDPSAPHTAVVEIRGEIDAGRESSAETVVLAMRGALEDKGSQALVLLINSPGGSPVQAGIINDEIVRLKAQHKKPVYVPWWRRPVPRPPITLPWRPTGFTSTRPALWAALAC
jgi:protease-4